MSYGSTQLQTKNVAHFFSKLRWPVLRGFSSTAHPDVIGDLLVETSDDEKPAKLGHGEEWNKKTGKNKNGTFFELKGQQTWRLFYITFNCFFIFILLSWNKLAWALMKLTHPSTIFVTLLEST